MKLLTFLFIFLALVEPMLFYGSSTDSQLISWCISCGCASIATAILSNNKKSS